MTWGEFGWVMMWYLIGYFGSIFLYWGIVYLIDTIRLRKHQKYE
jgi:hypothetical protein